jgi:hypothetical protein
MWRILLFLAVVATLAVTGCGDVYRPSVSSTSTQNHHEPLTDHPLLKPAGDTGTPALSQHVETMDELTSLVRDVTGECADAAAASDEELAEYLGPTRVSWYGPFVAEWATCRIAPHDKLGLVLFEPGQQRALQEFWLTGLASGEIADNPDWAFGNGFAVTAGPVGRDRLGLHFLWCEPVEGVKAHIVPADVEGCVYAK